ncbi:MAG: FIST signal transduction protein [Planctomycetaceae bacterium]
MAASETCRAASSTAADLATAVREVCDEVALANADLAFLFVSSDYGALAASAPGIVRKRLRPRHLLGCTVQGIVAGGNETERGRAAVLWAIRVPAASLETFHLVSSRGPEGFSHAGLPAMAGAEAAILLPDPFTCPVESVLEALGTETKVLGGVASGAHEPGGNRLFVDGDVFPGGCAGVVMRGVRLRPLVSQGCRPIGRPFIVTAASENRIAALAGQPALARLQETVAESDPTIRSMARRGLHIGLVMDEYKERHEQGDFLIRSVLGADAGSGALVVGDRVRTGQTVQFQVRDGASAQAEFERLLRAMAGHGAPQGALLFSCNGRGSHLFAEESCDARAVQTHLGPLPLAGFFAGGEIGPVGAANYLHGFTASLALFYA